MPGKVRIGSKFLPHVSCTRVLDGPGNSNFHGGGFASCTGNEGWWGEEKNAKYVNITRNIHLRALRAQQHISKRRVRVRFEKG
jgi:hypothetical protein